MSTDTSYSACDEVGVSTGGHQLQRGAETLERGCGCVRTKPYNNRESVLSPSSVARAEVNSKPP